MTVRSNTNNLKIFVFCKIIFDIVTTGRLDVINVDTN